MNRLFYFLLPLFLTSCQACLDDDRLIPLECSPGAQQLCDHSGAILSSLDPADPPKQAGICKYGVRTCSFDGWSECI